MKMAVFWNVSEEHTAPIGRVILTEVNLFAFQRKQGIFYLLSDCQLSHGVSYKRKRLECRMQGIWQSWLILMSLH